MELDDRSQMEKPWEDGKRNAVHIGQDFHQRAEDMV